MEQNPPAGGGLVIEQASQSKCRQTLHRIPTVRAAFVLNMATRLVRLSGVPGRFWLVLQQAYDLAHAETKLTEVLPRIPTHALPPTVAKELTSYGR